MLDTLGCTSDMTTKLSPPLLGVRSSHPRIVRHGKGFFVVSASQHDAAAPGQALAALRARHHRSGQPRYLDAISVHLIAEGDQVLPEGAELNEFHDAATAFLDEQLLSVIDTVDMQLKQETRQVVLVGCGLDTRPFRLPWPGGTVLFEVAPADAHAFAASRLKAAGVHVPRACLLRRVAAKLGPLGCEGLVQGLETAGLRGDRLSVWALQGLPALNLDREAMRRVLADVASCAAFGSTVVGELPVMRQSEAQNLIAEAGLLGHLLSQDQLKSGANAVDNPGAERQWVFVARCQHRSQAEMTMYADHTEAMEEAGEDFFGNFS